MHRCLKVCEIVNEIVDNVALPTDHESLSMIGIGKPEKRRDALAVALTCKQFLEPGLDTLWHSMQSLKPLLSFFINMDTMDAVNWLQEFNRQTAPRDLLSDIIDCFCGPVMSRFLYYSRRIKYLRVSSRDGFPPILFDVLKLIQRSDNPIFMQPDHPILLTPSLRGLVWQHPSLTTFPYIDFFAGPLLQKLYVGTYLWSQGDLGLLQHTVTSVQCLCPQLEELGVEDESEDMAVGGQPEDVVIDDELEDNNEVEDNGIEDLDPEQAPIASVDIVNLIVSAFPSLRRASIRSDISPGTLTRLSQMPNLRILERPHEYGAPPWMFDIPSGPNFAALQRLHLCGSTLSHYKFLIQSLSYPANLTSLSFQYKPFAEPVVVESFFRTVAEHCSPQALSAISLTACCCEDDLYGLTAADPNLAAVGLEVILPILSFRAIKKFSLHGCLGRCDDDILKRLTVAWPELEILCISSHTGNSSNFRLEILFHLAKNCPGLRLVRIPLTWGHGTRSKALPVRDWDRERPGCARGPEVALIGHDFAVTAELAAWLEDIFTGMVIPDLFKCRSARKPNNQIS